MMGETLKKIRGIHGLKAREVSQKLGISASYLSEIENGKRQPSLDMLKRYADIFDMKLSSLILLAENLDEAKKRKDGSAFIRNLMLKLIDGMSVSLEDEADEDS